MINIIGGTYREINFDDVSMEIFGSGFRSAKFLLENKSQVNFITNGNEQVSNFLKENQKVYPNLKFDCHPYDELITFQYSFALDEPSIFPNILNIKKAKEWRFEGDDLIAFGMLESEYEINCKRVVYDPQTSIKPKRFSDFGKAQELVYIINRNEAYSISSSRDIEDIKKYFFTKEKVKAFIIKNGPYGATLYTESEEHTIPCYVTNNVHKIGSGDIFTASFGYYWMDKKLSLEQSALLASKSTAVFCDKKAYVDCMNNFKFEYQEFKAKNISEKQVYLASPFFALSELILVDKIRNALLSFGVKVFSPFHDIGLGEAVTIAKKDIEGIKSSDVIFVVLDNLDSGTLIESGFSMANDKKIVGYHRTCNEKKLLMLKPGNFTMNSNLTTALYQTIWSL
ncbi:PfkB family carbohydrate kinase [Zunongwangia pacifica]|uniref:PfkB family carbohydrate kinase n=1 Tax=Zunongwangia pacifica TaxID=2911062 RepID=A0A9X1ZZR8_9FLAO|nr:PfkB family carbohydrate kinase [Zunongwangia pacifica]MCL6220703.1 PfkB family carbohydrate kinase [Zunongwangia pacifica]